MFKVRYFACMVEEHLHKHEVHMHSNVVHPSSSFWWAHRWLIRPICARKVLIQLGQGMVAGDGHLSAFDFLACRLFSAAMVLSLS